jgi:hypothetical protein
MSINRFFCVDIRTTSKCRVDPSQVTLLDRIQKLFVGSPLLRLYFAGDEKDTSQKKQERQKSECSE